jgi:hypothetical protein
MIDPAQCASHDGLVVYTPLDEFDAAHVWRKVGAATCGEVVKGAHSLPERHKLADDVGADETCGSGYQVRCHLGRPQSLM